VASARPSRAAILGAFATVYVVWGSTYLAIRYAIATIPTFLMAGARFLIAGAVLLAIARWRATRRPGATRSPLTASELRATAIIGVLLLFGGNGAVVWAEQRVPSGVAALLVATVPVWMVVLDWLRPHGVRPTIGVAAGLVLGLGGLLVLAGPSALVGSGVGAGAVDPVGAVVLTLGALSWAAGSIYSRFVTLPKDALVATGLEMLFGGAVQLVVGLLAGQWASFDAAAVTAVSWGAFLYLVTFGSLIGFTAYTWLLNHASPARVATYAYVNPVVAVLLGWAVAGEALTARMFLAAAVIIAGVVLITTARRPARAPAPERRIDVADRRTVRASDAA
jgi:drug/metabolite transporter (DMT)-like permease